MKSIKKANRYLTKKIVNLSYGGAFIFSMIIAVYVYNTIQFYRMFDQWDLYDPIVIALVLSAIVFGFFKCARFAAKANSIKSQCLSFLFFIFLTVVSITVVLIGKT